MVKETRQWRATKVFSGRKRKPIIPVGVIMPKRKISRKNNLFFDNKGFKKTKKHLTTELSLPALGIDTTNANKITGLNTCVQGTTESSRIGAKIKNISVQWAYRLKPQYGSLAHASTYTTAHPATRISIVYDKHPNGVKPKYYDVADVKNSIFNGDDPWDVSLFSNSERFTIIYTEVVTPSNVSSYFLMSGGAITYYSKDWEETREGYRKIGLETQFNDNNNGDEGDVSQGLLLLAITSEYSITTAGNNSNNSVSFNGDIKVRIEDV